MARAKKKAPAKRKYVRKTTYKGKYVPTGERESLDALRKNPGYAAAFAKLDEDVIRTQLAAGFRNQASSYARDGDTVKGGYAMATDFEPTEGMKDMLGTAYLGGCAEPGPDYYQTRPHIKQLRCAFPGVWIRADGAFRSEEFGVRWAPSDGLPSQNSVGDRKFYGPRKRSEGEVELMSDALVMFDSIDYARRGAELSLTQLQALTRYIEVESNYA